MLNIANTMVYIVAIICCLGLSLFVIAAIVIGVKCLIKYFREDAR